MHETQSQGHQPDARATAETREDKGAKHGLPRDGIVRHTSVAWRGSLDRTGRAAQP